MVDVICPPLSISSFVVSLWLAGCLAKSTLIGWWEYYGGGGVGADRHLCGARAVRIMIHACRLCLVGTGCTVLCVHPRVKLSIVGSLRDREVACSASDRQGSNFESCVWRTVSSHSSHHPQEVLLAQFSLYVHKGGLKPDSFLFLCTFDFNLLSSGTVFSCM